MPSQSKTISAGPLAGYRVVDMSRVLAGPWAGQLLADLGAEVFKIENPAGGDDTRGWGPPFVAAPSGEGATAAYFMSANRGKRSLSLDLKHPAARRVVEDLVRVSDVFIENFRVDKLARFGLDYPALQKINPALVYCSITGFGQTGPYRQRPGYDLLIQAMGGMMSITGPAQGEPCKVGVAITDLCAGLYASVAIQAALLERERSGAGQYIDLSLFDVQAAMLANQASNFLIGGIVPRPMGSAHPNIAPYQVFATADRPLVLAIGNDEQFAEFARLGGAESLASDPRFLTNRDRVRNREDLVAEMAPILASHTRDQWLALLADSRVPCGPVNTIDEVFDDPQIAARGMRRQYAQADGTEVELVANPIRFSRSGSNAALPPPALGADTATVLRETLGYSAAKIRALLSTNDT